MKIPQRQRLGAILIDLVEMGADVGVVALDVVIAHSLVGAVRQYRGDVRKPIRRAVAFLGSLQRRQEHASGRLAARVIHFRHVAVKSEFGVQKTQQEQALLQRFALHALRGSGGKGAATT